MTNELIERLEAACEEPHKMRGPDLWTEVRVDDVRGLISELRLSQQRVGELERQNAALVAALQWSDDTGISMRKARQDLHKDPDHA